MGSKKCYLKKRWAQYNVGYNKKNFGYKNWKFEKKIKKMLLIKKIKRNF